MLILWDIAIFILIKYWVSRVSWIFHSFMNLCSTIIFGYWRYIYTWNHNFLNLCPFNLKNILNQLIKLKESSLLWGYKCPTSLEPNNWLKVKHVSRHELSLTCFSLKKDKPVKQSETTYIQFWLRKKRYNFVSKCIRDRFFNESISDDSISLSKKPAKSIVFLILKIRNS